jgi:DNA-binding response OmpR family regulator
MHERDAFRPPHPTILLAEGDASLRRWLGVLLREAGYEVIEAGAESEVVRHLRGDAPIHLVITDTRLGRMPGWEIAQYAGTLRPGVPTVQLIGSSADGAPTYRHNSVLLWKPFTLPELLQVIRALLSPDVEGAGEADAALGFSTGPYTFYLRSPLT